MAASRPLVTPYQIEQMAQQLVERVRPARVVLLGSYAYGQPDEDSDLDVLVIMVHPPSRHEAWGLAREVGRALPVPVQLMFTTPDEYEDSKDVIGGLAYPAHHWGRVLYVAQPRAGDLGLRTSMAREGRD